MQYFTSVSEFAAYCRLPAPAHPLVSLVRLAEVKAQMRKDTPAFSHGFYLIVLRSGRSLQCGYGRKNYDFSAGVMAFLAPQQVLSWHSAGPLTDLAGYKLAFHPDFVQHHPLGSKLNGYSFFSYTNQEALHLSAEEQQVMAGLFEHMLAEYGSRPDRFSQDILIGHLELVLAYADRFYHRQFATRAQADGGLLARFEEQLRAGFAPERLSRQGLPTVQGLADTLHLSAGYLSDLLKTQTGKTAQEHIHLYFLEAAKTLLAGSQLTVSEASYQLGFDYPQYFARLFRRKTGLSPTQFRANMRSN
jgi:AraC-like DNA-binding protein